MNEQFSVELAPREQPMAPIRALFIDLDGVIRSWHSQHDPAAEARFGLPPGAVRRVAFAPDLLLPAITGQISDPVWRAQVVATLARQFPDADAAGAVRCWSATAGEVNPEVLELVAACRRRVLVVLVTNATSRLPDDLRRLGLHAAFDHVINSSRIGAAKPDPAIFRAALAAAGVDAPNSLFVDDTPGHVEAARGLGMSGYEYVGAAELRAALQARGLWDEEGAKRGALRP